MIRCQLKRLGVIAVAILVTVGFGFVASESIGFEDKDKNSVGLRGQHDEILGAGESEENSLAKSDRRAAINSQSRDDRFKSLIVPFLKKHCYKCHGSEESVRGHRGGGESIAPLRGPLQGPRRSPGCLRTDVFG